MKNFLKILLILVCSIVILAVLFIGYLTLTEYRPAAISVASVTDGAEKKSIAIGDALRLVSFNTGYSGLDKTQDFFMDGGKRSKPESRQEVEDNTEAICSFLKEQNADIYLLQEVDVDSDRSFNVNQYQRYQSGLGLYGAIGYNYYCDFVPIPLPPMGKVRSGIVTLSGFDPYSSERITLPNPFSWPVRIANLKRCLLIQRIPLEGSEKMLVIINLHLEAYDDGDGRARQTAMLLALMEAEREQGNYVIAGGDFNQTFEGAGTFSMAKTGFFVPSILKNSELPEGFSYAFDAQVPSCRSLATAYTGDKTNMDFYIIDGFIVSDNISVDSVKTIDLDFANSDHNPVAMSVTLKTQEEN
ncbi:MAG: endonuclease [Eubacteriales bacterium]|nr:endonuclease [Eubacteriales bacterium]MDD3881582.1 endonuclease [Eubacteriales bacterium]MDD4512359.1 endonuclease [Eubacteriales bacterium]